jgi:hypothetical protein
MRAERRSPTIWPRVEVNQSWEEPLPEAKPYNIPKQLVWDAYQRVVVRSERSTPCAAKGIT